MYKLSIITLVALISLCASAQTHQLAAKRHSVTSIDLDLGPDRFGLCTQMISTLDSVEKVNEKLVILHMSLGLGKQANYFKQEVEDHPVFLAEDFDIDATRKDYGPNVVWIGFESEEDEDQRDNSEESTESNSGKAIKRENWKRPTF